MLTTGKIYPSFVNWAISISYEQDSSCDGQEHSNVKKCVVHRMYNHVLFIMLTHIECGLLVNFFSQSDNY